MNKIISAEFIIKLLQLPDIARKKANKIITNYGDSIRTDNDLIKALQNSKYNFSEYELSRAFFNAERLIRKSENEDISFITYWDDAYPELLKRIEDYPILLHCKGNISALKELPTVAIIGTRNISDFGKRYGKSLAMKVSASNFNIISGLAVGCDTVGHLGALDAKGVTTAILGHGLDTIYPAENKSLAKRILENNGLLISEYFINSRTYPQNFVERDRIQAGLSLGTIVIETDIKGGTMHTVKFSRDSGRKIACINYPNEVIGLNNEGNKMLIREGKAFPIYKESEVESFLNLLKNQFYNFPKTRTSIDLKIEFPNMPESKSSSKPQQEKTQIITSEQIELNNLTELMKQLEVINKQIDAKNNEIKNLKDVKKRIEKKLKQITPSIKTKEQSKKELL